VLSEFQRVRGGQVLGRDEAGSSAFSAGRKNWSRPDDTNITATTIGTRPAESTSSSGSSVTAWSLMQRMFRMVVVESIVYRTTLVLAAAGSAATAC